MPPVNDEPAGAIALSGEFSGTFNGTTAGATPTPPSTTRNDVWYYWPDLPAGRVYLHLEEIIETGPYVTMGVIFYPGPPVTPPVLASGTNINAHSSGLAGRPLTVGFTHSGGALTLAVYTGTSVTPVSFRAGWGHDLDPDESHWGEPFIDVWRTEDHLPFFVSNDSQSGIARSGLYQIENVNVPPSESSLDCAWENARDGVVVGQFNSGADAYVPCTGYVGPGPGRSVVAQFDGAGEAGQVYQWIDDDPNNDRSDTMVVNQVAFSPYIYWAPGPVVPGSFPPSQIPRDFDYTDGWGWTWSQDFMEMGDLVGNFTVVPSGDPGTTFYTYTGRDVDCDVSLRSIPESIVVDVANPGLANQMGADDWTAYTYFDHATVAAFEEVDSVPDANGTMTVTVSIAGYVPFVADDSSAGAPWLSIDVSEFRYIAVSQQVLDGIRPPVPAGGTGWGTTAGFYGVAFGGADIACLWTWQWRPPAWTPYIGFPLAGEGWHVGRVGTGGPW